MTNKEFITIKLSIEDAYTLYSELDGHIGSCDDIPEYLQYATKLKEQLRKKLDLPKNEIINQQKQ